MEPAKVLLVLRYEEIEHRCKIFRGTPRAELLTSIREVLGMDPGLSIRFVDEDDDQVLLSSWAPSGTRLKVLSTRGGGGLGICEMLPLQPSVVESTAPGARSTDGRLPEPTSGGTGVFCATVPPRPSTSQLLPTPLPPPHVLPGPVAESNVQNVQSTGGSHHAATLDGVVAIMQAQQVELVIERLKAAELAIGMPASERLARARGALQGGAGLHQAVQAFKVFCNELRGEAPAKARDLRELLAAAAPSLRDVLMLRFIRDIGLMKFDLFAKKMEELLSEEFLGLFSPQERRNLWSSLKYSHTKIMREKLDRPDLCTQKHPHRTKKSKKKEPEPEQSIAEYSVASEIPSDTDSHNISPAQVPADVPMRIEVAHLSMPEPRRLRLDHFCVRNTFLDIAGDTFLDIADETQSAKTLAALTSPEMKQVCPASRKQVARLLRDIGSRSLSPEICANRAQSLSALLTNMPYVPVSDRTSKELLVVAARFHATNAACLAKILEVLSMISGSDFLQEMQPLLSEFQDPKAVAQCCRALGMFVQADGSEAAGKVVEELSTTMSRFEADADVQEACLDGLVKVMRASQEVLGLQAARHPCDCRLSSETRATISMKAQEALRCGGGRAYRAIRVLARMQPAPLIVEAAVRCLESSELLATALNEVIWDLEYPLAAFECRNDAEEAWARGLLGKVRKQCQPLQAGINITEWVFSRSRFPLPMRLTLAGLLFGIEQEILVPMASAVITPEAMWPMGRDEAQEVMHAACRALQDVNDHLVPFGSVLALTVVKQASSCMKSLMRKGVTIKHKVRCCFAGLLGTAMRGRAHEARDDGPATEVVENVVQDVLEVTQLAMPLWPCEEAFFDCALWALAQIFEGAPSLGKHQNDIQTQAHELLSNLKPLKDAGRCNDKQAEVVERATRLVNWTLKESRSLRASEACEANTPTFK